MKKIKKALVVALSTLMLVQGFACGKTNDKSSSSKPNRPTSSEVSSSEISSEVISSQISQAESSSETTQSVSLQESSQVISSASSSSFATVSSESSTTPSNSLEESVSVSESESVSESVSQSQTTSPSVSYSDSSLISSSISQSSSASVTPEPTPYVVSITVSGETTAQTLADVSRNVTVVAKLSNNATKTLTSSEYNVYVEYVNETTARVTVVVKDGGVSNYYNVALTAAPQCAHTYEQKSFTAPTTTTKGERVYECSLCHTESFTQEIPALSSANYTVQTINATCSAEGFNIYTSSVYGTYSEANGQAKLNHTTYDGVCDICNNNIGNLAFSTANMTPVFWGPSSYPRLLELKDGTWICGFDTWGPTRPNGANERGTIVVVRSTDKGKTWTKSYSVASKHTNADCANVAFFQMDNGDILCGYRAIDTTNHTRALHVTISKDNGYTWNYHSTIVTSENLKAPNGTTFSASATKNAIQNVDGRLGFFEPHFGIINGELNVMYADDLTTYMLAKRGTFEKDYETQYIIRRTLSGTTWSDAKIVLDGTVKKNVSNALTGVSITEYSRDGMPVFDRLSDGTYVLVVEGTYRDNTRWDSTDKTKSTRTTDDDGTPIETHPFEILLSYSKDGVNWSTPVEVYTPKGQGTKASAPYICVTEDDRLVISFQTDEEAFAHKGLLGDGVSVMKTIISDGTPVDKITAENFHTSQNVFDAPAGTVTSWNGMMLKGDTLYCVTGGNYPQSSIQLQSSKIPEICAKDYHVTSTASMLTTRNGMIGIQNDGWYKTLSANTLATINNAELYNGTISVDMIPNSRNDCGLVFRVTNGANTYWENNSATYYFYFLNKDGWLILAKVNGVAGGQVWTELNKYDYTRWYNPKELVNLKVSLKDHGLTCYINDKAIMHSWDDANNYKGLLGKGVGVRSQWKDTAFGNLKITPQ